MIGSLHGTVVLHTEKYCLLEVGGVGYKVYGTGETLAFAVANSPVFLLIHTVVREDALELYGFENEASISLFEKLISISGIGPRGALGILAIAPIENLRRAIAEGDTPYLTQVSGIGKKTAEKIILELRDKIGILSDETASINNIDSEVSLALLSLGYNQTEVREALTLLDKKVVGTNAKIKAALQLLAR